MRKVFILIFISFCATVYGRTYYVSTPENGGNDMYDGLNSVYTSGTHGPWASWEKAFTSTSVQAGDTVYIRGGVYYTTVVSGTGIKITRNGTPSDWIVYINYPGERPIIDFGNITAQDILYTGLRNDGIVSNGVNYVKLVGLTVRNVKQYYNRNYARAIYLRDGIVTLENCTAYNNWGHGIHSNHTTGEGGIHRIINCDSYNNCDSLSGDPLRSNAGATGNGFAAWSDVTQGETYFYNCRAWGVSDQGWSIGTDAYVRLEGCWSFANKAYVSGGGAGYKMGWQRIDIPDLRREVINCVAAFNDGYGFLTNENGSGSPPDWNAVKSNHFNNIAYHNGYRVTSVGFGFIIQDTEQADAIEQWRNFSNNIDYDNYRKYTFTNAGGAKYSGSNNSWDIPLTLTDADFISLDTTGITAPRQEDGSLPDNNCYNYFLKLSSTSKAINAGVNVGLPYNSSAPDLGPFESSDSEPTSKLVTRIDVVGYDGINTITGNQGTLQLSAIVFPSDATNKAVTWSIINGTGQATISPTGLVTAVSTGTVTARATARDGSGVYGSLVITISNQVVPVSGITVSASGGTASITATNGTLQLSASVLPTNATDKSVTWSVINGTGQATISPTGLVTAVSTGTVTARATARDGSGVYGSLVITISNQVVPVSGITVSASGGTASITATNGTLQLSASVLPTNATDKSVTWSVINGTGQATISPTGLVTAVSTGTVTARATARDGSGVSGSLVITISNQNPPTNTPPLVSISSPTKSTAFIAPATVTIEANAVDTDGVIVKVEFFNGNTKLGEKMTSPYEFTWKDVPAGSYSITAIATDNGNARTVSGAVTVVVEKSATDANQLPVISIISPANSGNNKKKYKKDDKITITAEATDPDGSISMVEFKSGNITLAEVTSAPYSFTWEPSDTGTFVITAIAIDNLGASSATSNIELSIVLLSESYTDNVNLYPNPNDGHFTVELVQEISELSNRITIFNLAGQNVYSGILEPGERIKEVDISESTSGTYILMITDGKNILATKKLTKK
ncbi:MAG: Ig-like domain-containing protein [Bacteroidales bacterium]